MLVSVDFSQSIRLRIYYEWNRECAPIYRDDFLNIQLETTVAEKLTLDFFINDNSYLQDA